MLVAVVITILRWRHSGAARVAFELFSTTHALLIIMALTATAEEADWASIISRTCLCQPAWLVVSSSSVTAAHRRRRQPVCLSLVIIGRELEDGRPSSNL